MASFQTIFNHPMTSSVSIIIVNYNSWQVLNKLLLSLTSQANTADLIDSLRIIIVDNNSSQSKPDFEAINQQFKQQNIAIQWIDNNNNVGFAGGCNIGAAHAHSDLLLFCNPDIEIPEQGLHDLLTDFNQHPVDLLAPSQVNKQGQQQQISGRFPTPLRYIPLIGGYFKKSKKPATDNHLTYCDWISGAVILMENKHFQQLNGWDENFFMFMEDVDLCYRATQLNLKVAVTHNTHWLHHHGISSKHHMADRVRSKSAALQAKHTYIHKHFRGWRQYLAQGLVALKHVPELLLGWLLSWLIPQPIFVSRRLILHRYLINLKNGFKKTK